MQLFVIIIIFQRINYWTWSASNIIRNYYILPLYIYKPNHIEANHIPPNLFTTFHFSPNLNKRELFISKMTTLWIVINFEKRGNYDKITEYQNIEISSSVKRAFKLQNFAKLLWNRGYELVYDKSRSLTAIEIVKIRGGKKNRGRIQIGGLSCTR